MQLFLDQVWYAVYYVYDFFFATIFFEHSLFLDHFWSLSVEEQFYIFWPLLILLIPEKWTKPLFISFIILALAFRILFYFVYQSGGFRFFGEPVSLALYPLPFNHLDAFAFGAYLSRYSIPKAKEQFLVLSGVIPIIGLLSQYLATGSVGAISAFGYPLQMPEAYQYIWGYTLLNYFFALIIQVVARQGMFNAFLEMPAMQYLGKISYGLYVYHYPIVWFSGRVRDLIPAMSETVAKPVIAVIAFIFTLLAAALSYRFLEKPMLNLKDRFFEVKKG
jgi:peptidoglycan/LPS O-acetylase OafA/YrhL